MQLDNMRVAIRPMTTAQAVDLGMMMARHWFVSLWKIWVGMALPFFLIYLLVILYDWQMQDEEFTLSMIYAMIFWWLKPIYEKPLLTWLSQALFANEMTVASTIKQGWKTIFSHWVKLLFSRRLSLSRQLLIPILLLENPTTYKQLNQRHRLLQRGQGSGVTWHTLLMVHVEFIVSMGVVLFIYALIPKEIMSSNLLVKFLEHTPVILVFSWAILYFLTLSIVAPFFICGGFAVYLTKRCLLEGWDIELIFKQLNGRFMAVQNDPFAREQRP